MDWSDSSSEEDEAKFKGFPAGWYQTKKDKTFFKSD